MDTSSEDSYNRNSIVPNEESYIEDSLIIDDSSENVRKFETSIGDVIDSSNSSDLSLRTISPKTPKSISNKTSGFNVSNEYQNLPITPQSNKSFTTLSPKTPKSVSNRTPELNVSNMDDLNEIPSVTPKTNKSFTTMRTPANYDSDLSDSDENEPIEKNQKQLDSDDDADLTSISRNFNNTLNSSKMSTPSKFVNSDSDDDEIGTFKKNKKKILTIQSDSEGEIVSSNSISPDLDKEIEIVETRNKSQTIQSDSEDEIVVSNSASPNFDKNNDQQTVDSENQKTQSDSDDVISVSSSPDPEEDNNTIDLTHIPEEIKVNKEAAAIKRLNKSIFKQPTLDMIVKKMESDQSFSLPKQSTPPANKDVIYCTQREYTDQATKVSNIRTDLKRTKLLQSTINKNNLPDKGASLMNRQLQLEKSLQEEELKLNKMVVETEELRDLKPNMAVPWEQLQAGSSAVVPRTWGKQAMQTHHIQKSLTMDRLKDLHGSLATCPADDVLADNPKNLRIELMPHQRHALAWLTWRENQKPSGGILADDMGLGKTLTMISLVLKSIEDYVEKDDEDKENSDDEWQSKNKTRKLIDGGTLVICPASLLKQWESEVNSKCKRNSLSVEVYHGTNRESKPKCLAKEDMIITTYNLAMRECQKNGPLYRIKWRRVILDEAHIVRNHKSQTSVAVCSLHAKARWALTGTPVHNKELDLYALLKFLQCSPFDDLVVWKRWVVNKNAGGQDRLNTVMKTIMLRRTKLQLQAEGALNNLPEKKFELIEVKLDKSEVQVYQKVLIFSRTLFAQFLHQRAEKNTDLEYSKESGKPEFLRQMDPNGEYYKMHKKILKMHGTNEIKSHQILVLLLRLRQICCHPSLIVGMLDQESIEDEGIEEDGIDIDIMDKLNKLDLDDDDDDVFDPNPGVQENFNKAASKLLSTSNEVFNLDRQNAKIRELLKIMQENVIPNGDKAVVVSQWTSMLRVVLYHFKDAGIKCDMLDGSVPVIKRNEIVECFNNPNHSMKVLLLSLTAGGVGLNLIGGNHLILLDLHWNPQLESQAQDRIYRVGQKKPVIIYKLVTLDTIEERIKALQDNKLQMASDILSGTKAMPGSKLTLEDLKMLFSV